MQLKKIDNFLLLNLIHILLLVINKIIGKLKFLYKKNKFLSPKLCKMLRNALIQPHFDYVYPSWYPNLTGETKKKMQTMQNKCIWCCLRLDKMQYISFTEFVSINWLSFKERVHQCINATTFKSVNNNCPYYLNEISQIARHCRIDTRNSFTRPKLPFCKTNTGQKTLS